MSKLCISNKAELIQWKQDWRFWKHLLSPSPTPISKEAPEPVLRTAAKEVEPEPSPGFEECILRCMQVTLFT
jgi:hypothetical protein